jgi:hypothetical protein
VREEATVQLAFLGVFFAHPLFFDVPFNRLLQQLFVNETKAFAYLRSMVNYVDGVARAYGVAHDIFVPVLHAEKKVEGPAVLVTGLHPTTAQGRAATSTTGTASAASAKRPSTSLASGKRGGASVNSATGGARPGPRAAVVDVAPGAALADDVDMSDSDDEYDDDEAVYAMSYNNDDVDGVDDDTDNNDDATDSKEKTANNTTFESCLHKAITRLIFKMAAVGFAEAFVVEPKGSTRNANGITPAWLTDQFWVMSKPRPPAPGASPPSSSTAGPGAAATTPAASSGVCTTWQLITRAMDWASVSTQAGFLADLAGFREALRVPQDLRGLQVGDPSKVPDVFLPGGHSIQYITECLVKLAGCRVLARARACAKRLQPISTVLFFEWAAEQACGKGELAICATTTLQAASSALNVGGGVKQATDLLVADTPECKAFRRNVSVATCLAAHRAELLSGIEAGVMDVDTVDGVASLVSYLQCHLATLQEKRRARQVAGSLLTKTSTRLDAALAVLMEKRDVWGTVVPPPTEALRVLHCPIDWARWHGLVGAAMGSYGQRGSTTESSVYNNVGGEKCAAVRFALLEAVLTTEEVDRVMARGGSCIGFTTNGLTVNLRVQRTVATDKSASSTALVGAKTAAPTSRGPAVDGAGACAHTGPALDQSCALANVRTMTPAARTLLGDGALTRIPFVAVGATVFAKCNGDFTALTLAQRLHVGDIALVCAGVDPTRPGRYSETMLRYPLAQGPSPPATRQRHIWLLACLREHDRRFAVSCDPGISSPLCFVDTALVHDAVTRNANRERRRDGDKRRYHMKQVETYRPRAQKGCIHRAYVPLSVLADAVDVVRRPGDPWRRFGPVVARAPRGNTAARLPPDQAQQQLVQGDHILRVHNHSLLAHNAERGNWTVGQHDGADRRLARCKRGPPV